MEDKDFEKMIDAAAQGVIELLGRQAGVRYARALRVPAFQAQLRGVLRNSFMVEEEAAPPPKKKARR